MITRVCVTTAAVLATAAFAVPGTASATDGTPCGWTVTVAAVYRIGPTIPKATVAGTCASQPTSTLGPQNWRLNGNVHNSSGTTVSGTTLAFQGCSHVAYDLNNQCADVNNPGAVNDYPYRPTITLRITKPGQYHTADAGGSYAVDFNDINGYDLTFTSTKFTAKLDTTTGLSITRSGRKRTFTVTPRHWWVTGQRYVRSFNTTVDIQRYVNSKWSTYKAVKSTAYPIRFTASFLKAYKWRAHTPTTATGWSSTSRTVSI